MSVPLPVELPISKHFNDYRLKEIDKYVDDRLSSLKQQLRQLREDKMAEIGRTAVKGGGSTRTARKTPT